MTSLLEELQNLNEADKTMDEAAVQQLQSKLSKESQMIWKKEKKIRYDWANAYVEALVVETYERYFDDFTHEYISSGKMPSAKEAKSFVQQEIDYWFEQSANNEKLSDYLDHVDPRKFINKHVKIK